MSREEQIIKIISAKLGLNSRFFPLDDVALINTATLGISKQPRLLAFKCDMLVGSTDVPPSMLPAQIARKSLVSCISDFAAKGILPSSCLLSLGIPKLTSLEFIKSLAQGFLNASVEFGMNILGGDTNHSREFVIDCSMLGHTSLPISRIPVQSGARPGDIIVTSGPFGQTAAGLKIILDHAEANGQSKARFISAVMMPEPRLKFGVVLGRHMSSSIDSSDGLAYSLYRIATKSKVDFVIKRIPIAAGIKQFALENKLNCENLVMYGGEEFEIVGTIPSKEIRTVKRLANSAKIKLIEIGKVSKGNGRVLVTKEDDSLEELEDRGFSSL